MKNCNEETFTEVVKTREPIYRHYCEWLIDAPTYGARIFQMLNTGWGTNMNKDAARDFPDTYALLERHRNNDPELLELQEKLQVKDKEPKTWKNIA